MPDLGASFGIAVAVGAPPADTPERRLLRAVLALVVADIRNVHRSRLLAEQAWQWLQSDTETPVELRADCRRQGRARACRVGRRHDARA